MQNDPLAELRDIHLPQAIAWWPPAIGWWLLVALMLLGLAYAVWKWRIARLSNTYRRQALKELELAWKQFRADGDMQAYVKLANIILRRAALHRDADNRRHIAPLAGQKWLDYLDSCCSKPVFSPDVSAEVLESYYRPPELHSPEQEGASAENSAKDSKKVTRQFHLAAMKWLQSHP